MKAPFILLVLCALAFAGCSKKSPTPSGMLSPTSESHGASAVAPTTLTAPAAPASARPAPGRPGYEPAYEDGRTVTINAIEVPGKAPAQAQADFYEVVYPPDWQALGIPAPQCDPCDHEGNGVDPTDYHDHVLDSSPGDTEYRAPWHVFLVVPAYTGNASHDAELGQLYKSHLPLKSEADVDAFENMKLSDGSPTSVEVDTQFYFLCAVVSTNAMGH